MKKKRVNSNQQKRNFINIILFSILGIIFISALYLIYFSPQISLNPEEKQLQEVMTGVLSPIIGKSAANRKVICTGKGKITDPQGNSYTQKNIENALLQLNGANSKVVRATINQICTSPTSSPTPKSSPS